VQRILNASPGDFVCRNFIFRPALGAAHFERFPRCGLLLACRQKGVTFAAFGGHTDFFCRYPVGSPAIRTTDDMDIRLIHQIPQSGKNFSI
jgi:hypothetical protein